MFGVPDAKYGEEVCAWIVLKAGTTASEEEIREFCRGQIAHYKVPRYVRLVAELPKTVTGKAQKFVDARGDDAGARDPLIPSLERRSVREGRTG